VCKVAVCVKWLVCKVAFSPLKDLTRILKKKLSKQDLELQLFKNKFTTTSLNMNATLHTLNMYVKSFINVLMLYVLNT